jgi:phosphohistidine swiveling domain-containing protein
MDTNLHNITENKQSIFDYIKSQKWFFGVRADESLLFYSAKRNGYVKYIKKEYGIEFAETLLIPLKKNYPIRVFNLWQAKKFHTISNEKILKNPQILISYAKKNDLLYQDIEAYSKKLIVAIKKNGYHENIRLFNKIFGLYEIASAQFIIVFSLGLKLAENKENLKNIKGVIKKHDIWRNNVAFKEEAIGENLFYFFKFLTKRKKLKLAPLLLMKFLTLNEVEAWLNGKSTDAEIKNIIKSRKNHGFIYLNLRNEKREVIDDPAEITKIQKYFLKLDEESKKLKNDNEITGQIAYSSSKTLRGRVIVIKDKSELKNKNRLIDGKILVAIQTTPHYIPYMKKAKAIITDEGGLTCHAAIVAREFKIPCIVGTKTATQILKDDNIVEIDTSKGTIKINK